MNFDFTFPIYGPMVKKMSFRFFDMLCINKFHKNLTPYIAGILIKIYVNAPFLGW